MFPLPSPGVGGWGVSLIGALSIRCTQVTIWNHDKGKLILMLQVRQVISLVTSHPYLPFCRHIIPILNFISIECVISFVNKVIPMQQCCFRSPKLRLQIYFSMLYLLLVLTLTKILTVQTNYYQLYKQNLLQFSLKCHKVILEFTGSLNRRSNLVLRTIL